jgi:hypothetical protein
MAKRGRPPLNPEQQMAALVRNAQILDFYHELRRAGTKQADAVRNTARKLWTCETVVKETLSNWQPERATCVFTVSRPVVQEIVVPGIGKIRLGLTVGVGPRPFYRRINAKER